MAKVTAQETKQQQDDQRETSLLEAGQDDKADSGRNPWGPISLILVIEFCERLCYYTISGSIRNFVQRGGRTNGQAASIAASFGTIGWMMCLPGGIVSDKYGLYGTILAACVIYVTGTAVIALSAIPPVDGGGKLVVYLLAAMILVPIGMGGIKPNIMNFGANQITAQGAKADKQRESFFSYFYVSINLGCILPFAYLVTLATSGQPPAIPQDWGFFAAYLIAAVAMAVAGMLYVSGTRIYVHKKTQPPPENEILVIFRTIIHTAKQGSARAMLSLFGWSLMPIFVILSLLVSFTGGAIATTLTYTALGLGVVSCFTTAIAHMDNSFLQQLPVPADRQGSDDLFTVEDVKATLQTVPLMILINISFNLCYNSMNAVFPTQACQMDCYVSKTQQFNGAFFNIGDCFAIIIFTPIFEAVVFPLWKRIQGKEVSLGQKLMAGLVSAALSNAVAAILETARKASPLMTDRGYTECGPADTYMNKISAFWMFVPFCLVGIGEILVNPSMYYYAYEAAPKKVRATVQAFNLVAQGSLSGAFSAALATAFVPDHLNKGNLNIYYYVNIAVALFGIVLYAMYRRQVGSSRDFVRNANLEQTGASASASRVGSFVNHPTLRDA